MPSFRHVQRNAQAQKIYENLLKIQELSNLNVDVSTDDLLKSAIEHKIAHNIQKIRQITAEAKITKNISNICETIIKALTAGYGGAGAPTSRVLGSVVQGESLEPENKSVVGKGFKYITCDNCGQEQIYSSYQVKCRKCNKTFSLDKLLRFMEKANNSVS